MRCSSTFAFPSTAGAAMRTRSRSPDASITSLRRAPAATRTEMVIPPSPGDHHDRESTSFSDLSAVVGECGSEQRSGRPAHDLDRFVA